MEPKKHIGKRNKIKYIGGDYHGEEKIMRGPLQTRVEVAKPPRYLGNNQYDANSIGYETYFLQTVDGEFVYVWENWLSDFALNPAEVIEREFESLNARAIRIEKEEEERQRKLAEADFKTWGIVVLVNGKRVHPREVKIIVNTKHPRYEQMFAKKEKLYNDERT